MHRPIFAKHTLDYPILILHQTDHRPLVTADELHAHQIRLLTSSSDRIPGHGPSVVSVPQTVPVLDVLGCWLKVRRTFEDRLGGLEKLDLVCQVRSLQNLVCLPDQLVGRTAVGVRCCDDLKP